MCEEHPYRGRFAPSPTGRLHLGSLACALASWIDARAHDGIWLVRIEDIDSSRVISGIDQDILKTLEGFGLVSDIPVVRQSERHDFYETALETLRLQHHAYPCTCTRRAIEAWDIANNRPKGFYPGICRDRTEIPSTQFAWRFRLDPGVVTFIDRRLGIFSQDVEADCGDFIIKRSDGDWAYQLAVVVDDAMQGVTDIVRGEDLLDNTPRQIALMRALGYPIPRYLHIPLVCDADGAKLSKQTMAKPVEVEDALDIYESLWRHFGFKPTHATKIDAFLRIALDMWKERFREPA